MPNIFPIPYIFPIDLNKQAGTLQALARLFLCRIQSYLNFHKKYLMSCAIPIFFSVFLNSHAHFHTSLKSKHICLQNNKKVNSTVYFSGRTPIILLYFSVLCARCYLGMFSISVRTHFRAPLLE